MATRHIENVTVVLFVLLLVVGCQQKSMQPLVKHMLSSKEAPAAIGPYSQAIRVGNTLYCSGQIAIDPQRSELVDDTIKNETRQVLENLGAVLRAPGGSTFWIAATPSMARYCQMLWMRKVRRFLGGGVLVFHPRCLQRQRSSVGSVVCQGLQPGLAPYLASVGGCLKSLVPSPKAIPLPFLMTSWNSA